MKVPNPLRLGLLLSSMLLFASALEARVGRAPHFRIGFVYSRTGPLAAFGQSMSDGLKLGLSQFRAENPQLGAQVGVIVADDGSLASEAEKATERLIKSQKVHLIIGSQSNIVNKSITQVASSNQVLVLLPRASDESLLNDPLSFGLMPTDRRQGQLLARFALSQLRRDKAVTLTDDYQPDGEMVAKGFSEVFDQNGGHTLGSWRLEIGKSRISAVMNEIAKLQPQLIVYPGSYRTLGPLIEAARKAGIKATWLGGDGWDHEDLFRLTKDLGAQYHVSYFNASDPTAGVQNFATDFEAAYGYKPDIYASQGYTAIRIVLQAYAAIRSTDQALLSKALQGGTFAAMYSGGHFGRDRVYLRPMPFLVTSGGQARFMSRLSLEE